MQTLQTQESGSTARNVNMQEFEQQCQKVFERYLDNVIATFNGDDFLTNSAGVRVPIDSSLMRAIESAQHGIELSDHDQQRCRVAVMLDVMCSAEAQRENGQLPPYTCAPKIRRGLEHYVLRWLEDPAVRSEIAEQLQSS